MKALALSLAKLGDFVQATPLFWGLSQRVDELGLLCSQKSVAEAANLSGLFSEVVSIDPTAEGPIKLPFKAQAVYNLSLSPLALNALDKIVSRLPGAAVFGPRREKGALTLPLAQEVAFAVMRENRRLAPFNLVDVWRRLEPGQVAPAKLHWPKAAPRPIKGPASHKAPPKNPAVGLILGSGHQRRRWPRERHRDLAQKLMESRSATVYLLGGPGERALGKALRNGLPPGPGLVDLVGQTDLYGLGRAIEGLDLLIGSDTGALHLGAALGVPSVGLYFGPALARETGPYAPGGLVVQTLAPCGPCPESRPCPDRACQALPETETVFLAASHLLGQAPLEGNEAVWSTAVDSFGYRQSPTSPQADQENVKAVALREAARAAVDPDYEPQRPMPGPGPREDKFWRDLADRIWPQANHPSPKRRFLEALGAIGLLG
ncbi:MAG: glycosyltransferase family 9 protein [Deltaproteobacteria bacterium]|nr:glycosyltransferase family 9 protein [Deltaproteobacteria bacterium]